MQTTICDLCGKDISLKNKLSIDLELSPTFRILQRDLCENCHKEVLSAIETAYKKVLKEHRLIARLKKEPVILLVRLSETQKMSCPLCFGFGVYRPEGSDRFRSCNHVVEVKDA